MKRCLLAASTVVLAVLGSPASGQDRPVPAEGDTTLRDFRFDSGEVLEELKLHYRTLGSPRRDRSGTVRNAVLIMHGTTGSGAGFLSDQFAGALFKPGQLLDSAAYFIILPDAIGHGQSSKPSDGMHARFPRYGYNDMVTAQYRLLTEGLGVNHLRLVMGTSMGGMHTWLWGVRYPDFMDALLPLASLPVQIAGRNRMMRRMVTDSIKGDPAWKDGEYSAQPRGLTAAIYTLLFMTSSPLQWHKQAPNREAADRLFDDLVSRYLARADANDMLYAFDASRDYDPAPGLERINAPLVAINSADDQVNPPELGIMEAQLGRVKRGRYVLIPISDSTRGHGSHSLPELWQEQLALLLRQSEPGPDRPPQEPSSQESVLRRPQHPLFRQPSPQVFRVRIETSKGSVVIEAQRDWAALGCDRFYNLVRAGFLDDSRFFRIRRGAFVQFGIPGDPSIAAAWKGDEIPDDEVRQSNTRGSVAFAMTGPNTRTTQLFINLSDNSRLDAEGFAPIGRVVAGMEVVDQLYADYGEEPGGGMRGGKQGRMLAGGNAYLDREFPRLDRIIHAVVEEP